MTESVSSGSLGSSSIVKSKAADKSGARAPVVVLSDVSPSATAAPPIENKSVVLLGMRDVVTLKFAPSARDIANVFEDTVDKPTA